jgi:hypothetical protein
MKTLLSLRKSLYLLGVCAFTMGLFSCSHDENQVEPTVSGFMAFNLSPDQAVVGISLSGNTLNTPLPYTNYTGGYLRIFPGQRSTESFDINSGNTLASTTYTYTPGKYYSLFVTGLNGTYTNVIVDDGLDTLSASSGKSYIRYINAIIDSSLSQVIINDGEGDVVSEQAGLNSVSSFVPVNTGSVTISIDNGDKISATRNISLEESKAYTVLFLGNPAGMTPADSIQIRYIENGTLTVDSSEAKIKASE